MYTVVYNMAGISTSIFTPAYGAYAHLQQWTQLCNDMHFGTMMSHKILKNMHNWPYPMDISRREHGAYQVADPIGHSGTIACS